MAEDTLVFAAILSNGIVPTNLCMGFWLIFCDFDCFFYDFSFFSISNILIVFTIVFRLIMMWKQRSNNVLWYFFANVCISFVLIQILSKTNDPLNWRIFYTIITCYHKTKKKRFFVSLNRENGTHLEASVCIHRPNLRIHWCFTIRQKKCISCSIQFVNLSIFHSKK